MTEQIALNMENILGGNRPHASKYYRGLIYMLDASAQDPNIGIEGYEINEVARLRSPLPSVSVLKPNIRMEISQTTIDKLQGLPLDELQPRLEKMADLVRASRTDGRSFSQNTPQIIFKALTMKPGKKQGRY